MGDAVKKSPEEIAEKLAQDLRKDSNRAAELTPGPAVGRKTLELLASQDMVSLDDLIVSFEKVLADAVGKNDFGAQAAAGEAEGVIAKLRSLRRS